MLFDTDMLVWVFRGNRKAATLLDRTVPRAISIVTYMELVQGAHNRAELRRIKSLLSDLNVQTLPLTENIGYRAAVYMEEYGLKAGLCLADALIAATAAANGLTLVTGNRKHFAVIENLEVRAFRP